MPWHVLGSLSLVVLCASLLTLYLTLYANTQEVYDDLVARERRLRAAEADLAEAAAERERALGEREAAASAGGGRGGPRGGGGGARRAAALRAQARAPARRLHAERPRTSHCPPTLSVLWTASSVTLAPANKCSDGKAL